MKKDTSSVAVYAILLEWPADNMVKLGAPITSAGTTVTMLGYKKPKLCNMHWKFYLSAIGCTHSSLNFIF
jgi:hypothetical protein